MITTEDENFLNYWSENREMEKKISRQLMGGLPWGLLIGAGIVGVLFTGGWYEQAIIEANSEFNAFVLLFAVIGIAVFTGVFYKKYRWDLNEQHYKEILHKKSSQNL